MAILNPSSDPTRAPMTDLSIGGQNGIIQNPYQWTALSNYTRQKLIAVLITAPTGIHYLENSTQLVAALKSLIEIMPTKISGLNSSVTWEYDGQIVGNAGEKMESAIGASRAVSAPAFEWPEKQGMAIARFWTYLGSKLILDPDTRHPGLISEPGYIAANQPTILPEMQAFTVLFIEPDLSLTYPVNAWLSTNMQPRSGGDITGVLEMAANVEISTVPIEFTAMTLIGKGVNIMARNYLQSLKLTDIRPLELKPYYDKVDANVDAAASGFANEISIAVMPETV